MAITSSGNISLLALQNEFGGSNPISISEYYAGAGLVPPGTLNGANAAIPSSGQISLGTFYGSTAIPNPLAVQVLIVGAGGGGIRRSGSDNAAENGGAGAGGYVAGSFNLPRGTYSFTVGAGVYQGTGGDTVAFGYTAYGGGYGGPSDAGGGGSGGSGGGAAERTGAYGSAIQPNPTTGNYTNLAGYGYNGAGGPHGCGGGAGGAGSQSSGGDGRQWIDGNYYAGGGGSSYSRPGGLGGGGGATGDGTYYGGGGGGGPSGGSSPWSGTTGYQGIVIISYTWSYQLGTGGTVTQTGTSPSITYYHAITSSSQTFSF